MFRMCLTTSITDTKNTVKTLPINWWNSLSDREKDWVENVGTCRNGSLQLARVSGRKSRFMVMLAQMETYSWLTTSNWKLTSRLTWKDFIRLWGFSMLGRSEKMCAVIHLEKWSSVISTLGRKAACFHKRNSCFGPVLELVHDVA